MSPKPPRVTGPELVRALLRAGWVRQRKTGSHAHLTHPNRPGVLVTVAEHAGQPVPIGTLAAVLKQAGLSGDDLRRLL